MTRITHETVASFFPADPPQFYMVPFSLADPEPVRAWLAAAGFTDVETMAVEHVGVSPSAAEAAIGLIDGNPIATAITERRPGILADVKAAVARNVAKELGERPVRSPLRAWVYSAVKR